ncbi:MAG TPA: (2Fe-2S)-binding protein, partial [Candidatus Pullilachnospira stercoravium]|nr:(2Fe-2S)-binding protein [Candidatus Pullilachnospira stercoravium]
MVNLTINGIPVSVKEGTTILEAARSAQVHIPTLCYLKDINEIGACRVCVV